MKQLWSACLPLPSLRQVLALMGVINRDTTCDGDAREKDDQQTVHGSRRG